MTISPAGGRSKVTTQPLVEAIKREFQDVLLTDSGGPLQVVRVLLDYGCDPLEIEAAWQQPENGKKTKRYNISTWYNYLPSCHGVLHLPAHLGRSSEHLEFTRLSSAECQGRILSLSGNYPAYVCLFLNPFAVYEQILKVWKYRTCGKRMILMIIWKIVSMTRTTCIWRAFCFLHPQSDAPHATSDVGVEA